MSNGAAKDLRPSFMMRALSCSSHAYKLAGLLSFRYGSKDGASRRNGRFIFPSQEMLARDRGVAERHLRRILKELTPIGLRVEIRRGPRTGRETSFYSFDGPIIPDTRDLNSDPNSGHERPKSSNATAPLQPEFRTFQTIIPDTTAPLTIIGNH